MLAAAADDIRAAGGRAPHDSPTGGSVGALGEGLCAAVAALPSPCRPARRRRHRGLSGEEHASPPRCATASPHARVALAPRSVRMCAGDPPRGHRSARWTACVTVSSRVPVIRRGCRGPTHMDAGRPRCACWLGGRARRGWVIILGCGKSGSSQSTGCVV